jgi:hypothetical protein
MFIYNVTVNVDAGIHDAWLAWMRQSHIPDVLRTGCFTGCKLVKVLFVNEEGFTYSVQYTFKEIKDIETYQGTFAKKLQAEHTEKFGQGTVAFRTMLEIIETFE